jgi:hypothetical protein
MFGRSHGSLLAQMYFVMKRIDLIEVKHGRKIGESCEYIEPNITEDCIFYADGEPIGFYLTKMPEKMCKLADLANVEFRSKNVPKSLMARAGKLRALQAGKTKEEAAAIDVEQYSTIIGSVPPKALMRREYKNRSSVHSVKSAQTFIKAMLLLAKESENLIEEILPKQYENQIQLFKQVPDEWKFGNLFTSSISNYNISAPFHRDAGNIVGAVNVIICKQKNAKGGDLHIPDYNATIGQIDNSILVYPAWRNMHGVTPIIPLHEGGYRNSLVFYPLKAFINSK